MNKPISRLARHVWVMVLWFGPISLLLSACLGTDASTPTPAFFIPPTLAATPLPPQSLTATPGLPSPTPSCEDNLVFLEDLTIPDGTRVAPGAELDKRWSVQNAGTCNWDNDYGLSLVAGTELGVPAEQALFPARSGTDVEIRIVFSAPDEPGAYRSAWQAVNPEGRTFGDPIFIEIIVEENPATTVP